MARLKKAYLEITNVCNRACSFCPGTKRASGFVSPESFALLAARLRPHTDYLYLHLMGEPLLHPQLEQLLTCAHSLGFRVILTTNGTLLPTQQALLCASPAVERVSISLHAFEGNEDTGPRTAYLDGCVRFAHAAAAAGKRCVLRLWNLDEADTAESTAKNAATLERLAHHFPTPWDVGRRGTTLAERVYLEWGERFDWPALSAPAGDGTGFCYGLRDQIGVLWDGTVVPCCLDHEGDIPLGNLLDTPLEDILSTPRAQAIYHGFSNRRTTEELCRRCGYMRRFVAH